ncbi:YHS domain-containing (seleno)protein [Polycladidibacter stylochi]|uniref:YHS domain-containing (seleno)protein n=1 Tax=Polycladidibacter stylochi TaxID=1807766 RepID=UPI00138F3334|nr:YHS domain-containing (seleno)protein [Pseudovibrio stylochi]
MDNTRKLGLDFYRLLAKLWWALVICIIITLPISGFAYSAPRAQRLALHGYDPVAYQLQKAAVSGSREYELSWQNVLWRFRSEGNMAAFMQAPRVYAPVFAGCDPFALADGHVAQGNPRIFAIYQKRLLLFYSRANRYLFFSDPHDFWNSAVRDKKHDGCRYGQ